MHSHATPISRNRFRKFLAKASTHVALAALLAAAPAYAAERSWNTGNGVWGSASNWSPVGFIGFGDSARVGNLPVAVGAQVNMDVNVTCLGLTVEGQSHVNTNGRQVVVNGVTQTNGSTASNILDDWTQLIITNGAAATDFETDNLQLLGESVFRTQQNPSVLVNGALSIGPDALLIANGGMTVNGSFTNSGSIRCSAGNLTINVAGGNSINLDGAGEGNVYMLDPGRSLTINAQSLSDPFDGLLYIGNDCTATVNVSGSWAIGTDGRIIGGLIDAQGVDMTLQGSPLTFGGELTIAETGNTVRMASSSVTIVPFAEIRPGPENTVAFENQTTIDGGLFDLESGARARFEDTTVVNGGDFQIEAGARVEFNGPTTVDGGTFAGVGSTVPDVRFKGPTTHWTGVVSFAGAAQQDGTAIVNQPTVINADYFDLDGVGGATTVWNINHTLAINADHVDLEGFGDIFDGTLNLAGGLIGGIGVNPTDSSASWWMDGTANLTGDSNLYPTRISGAHMYMTGTLAVVSGRAQITAPTTIQEASTVNLPAASTHLRLNARSSIQSGATFTGPGLLINGVLGTMRLHDGVATDQVGLQNRGGLSIADAGAGAVTVDRFEQVAGARMRVSLGGESGGSEHDLMVVAGAATLAGALEVELFNIGNGQFTPQVGDEFTILTAGGGVIGTFDANPVSCAGDSQYHWTVLYETNEVTVRLDSITAGVPGDMNCDCLVTVSDIGPFVMAISNPAGYEAAFPECSVNNADVNGDGFVTVADIGPFVALLAQ